jgi:hypothetical protein
MKKTCVWDIFHNKMATPTWINKVALIRQGIDVIEREVEKAKTSLKKQQDDMARFKGSSHVLWYPFRNKCYTLKEGNGNFKFCPFQVNIDGVY